MKTENRIKLIFNSRTAGLVVVEEVIGDKETNIINNINSSFGVSHFPKVKLEITPNNQYPNLILIKSGDEIEIHTSGIKHFRGFLRLVTIKSTKEKFELVLDGISMFYLLEDRKVSYDNFKVKTGLREVLAELVTLCGINGTTKIDMNISNDFTLFPFKAFPALSFINAICYKLDLVYDFNFGDIMTFSRRKDIIDKLNTSIPYTLDKNDIISSEFQQ